MNRRRFTTALGAVSTLALFVHRPSAQTMKPATRTLELIRTDWKGFIAPEAKVVLAPTPADRRHNDEWRKVLSREQYHVLRDEGTEPPGTSPLNQEKRPGVFACAGCGLALFTTEMKFDSGTGWPSFFTSIPGHLATKRDFKLILPRTEYHCARCGGHHGHVFRDGPPPTGERYCNNGVALRFVPVGGTAS